MPRRNSGKASKTKSNGTDRRRQAFELRKRGLSFDEIGDRLGITRQSAHALVTNMLTEMAEQTKTDVKAVLEMELARLDTMIAALWTMAETGDLEAIDRAVKLMERRAKYLGLDAANRTEISGPDGTAIAIETLRAKLDRIPVSVPADSAPGEPDPTGS